MIIPTAHLAVLARRRRRNEPTWLAFVKLLIAIGVLIWMLFLLAGCAQEPKAVPSVSRPHTGCVVEYFSEGDLHGFSHWTHVGEIMVGGDMAYACDGMYAVEAVERSDVWGRTLDVGRVQASYPWPPAQSSGHPVVRFEYAATPPEAAPQ